MKTIEYEGKTLEFTQTPNVYYWRERDRFLRIIDGVCVAVGTLDDVTE